MSNKCFTNETINLEELIEKTKAMKSGTEKMDFICDEDVKNFSRLSSCLDESKKSNPLSFMVFSSLPKFKTTLSNLVTSHNQSCPETTIFLPQK